VHSSIPAASIISSSKIIQQHPKASVIAGFFIGLLSINGQLRRLTSGGNWRQLGAGHGQLGSNEKELHPFMPLTNTAVRNVKPGNKPASSYSCPTFSN
jgi:hypothetical protein